MAYFDERGVWHQGDAFDETGRRLQPMDSRRGDNNGGGMARVTPGVSDPPDVRILHGEKRAGAVLKDRYVNHLNELFAAGYMSQDEHQARVTYAGEEDPMTEGRLLNLIEDLPPLPSQLGNKEAVIEQVKNLRWKNLSGRWRLAVFAFGVFLGVCLIFGAIATFATVKHIHLPVALGATITIIAGVALAICSIVWGMLDKKIQKL